MLTIEMLPARNGDCLWLTYGEGDERHHVLVDVGYRGTSDVVVRDRLAADPALRFELLILTHIDEDHLDGAVQLLADDVIDASRVGDFWFNGWKHLVDLPEEDDELGARQGEYFSALIERKQLPWNQAWGEAAVLVPAVGPLPRHRLPGGLKLTVLSPDAGKLRALRASWKAELKRLGLRPGDAQAAMKLLFDDSRYDTDELGFDVDDLARAAFEEDGKAPNGSSIAVLAEYRGHKLLLAGDAHPSVVAASLGRLGASADQPLHVDVLKLAHHGSAHNTSPELLELLTYDHVLVSTNGEKFAHPDAACLARVVHDRADVQLHFNYVTTHDRAWLDPGNQRSWRYQADHGDEGTYLLTLA